MGCMLRSDDMTYCEMFIQPEAATEIMGRLGEKGCCQFEDMNPELGAFQRKYITDLCRYAELERTLRYVESEMKKDGLQIPQMKVEPPPLHPNELNDFESMLEKWEEDIIQMGAYQTQLLKNQKDLQEMNYVFKSLDPLLGDAELRRESLFTKTAGGEPMLGGKVHIETGVVKRSKSYAFETMLWRVSRGNIYFRTVQQDELFEDPQTGTMIREVAFIAVCQGDRLQGLLSKVCTGFHAHTFPCPRTYSERKDMLLKLESRINDLSQVIRKSRYHRCKQFRMIGKTWEQWLAQVKKSKAIYHRLNEFSLDITRKCLIGQCWMPTKDLKSVHEIFHQGSSKSGSKVESFMLKLHTIETPPTYHRTNKFTRGFQALICAYGDSAYRELNPGLYTLITFPFLFAVMFGDCGHGSIMLAFALWMVIKEKKFMAVRSTNEIWNIFFGGRYVILVMSMFTMYTGFVYNDWFSKPLRLKANFWINQFTADEISNDEILSLDPAGKTNEWYLLGVDPVWAFSKNKIMAENSLKMKLSIILGIMQMMFGLWLSLVNHIYFKKYYSIFLEFIPQVMFLTCLFVWLVFLIVFKWLTYGPKETNLKTQPGCAPLILILFIDMCLMRTTKLEEGSECDAYMFKTQEAIQKYLLVLALINVPIMLFGTPIYLTKTNKKKLKHTQEKLAAYLASRKKSPDAEGHVDKIEEVLTHRVQHYSESFGELMIHQGVHTIEYVLSTISHTASYLRLWALSLAHAQLSEMLWGMVLSKLALQDHSRTGAIKIFIVFAIWAAFSLSILVVMEGLSAFLHTLRLHWVEFMSKFFIGSGNVFHPFSFQEIVYGESKEDKGIAEGACKKRKKQY